MSSLPGLEWVYSCRQTYPSLWISTWIRVDSDKTDRVVRYVSLNEMVARNLPALFPGMEVIDMMAFRITRNADIERDEPAFSKDSLPKKNVHWVKPKLVGQVGFTEWTGDGKLRHPRFKGLRRDKKPKDVVREKQ